MRQKAHRFAVKIAVAYFIVAAGWVFFSDELGEFLAIQAQTFSHFDEIKDIGFALLTAGFLYWLLQQRLLALAAETQRRLEAEQALRPSERALRAIGACNRALVRATDEPGLLREICRVAVEQGGYRMAWVGYPQADDAKSVSVAASAGHEAGYLEGIKVSWDDRQPEGRGPCGTAIRSGQAAVFNCHSTDPNFQPWRTAAAARGYAASVGLPLLDGARCFGVLSIYAAEANAFSATELDLLKELASDLAFGVLALRLRDSNRRAEAALRESQTRYALMEQAVNDGMWDWNILTNEDYFSLRFKDIIGYADHDLTNQKATFLTLLHPDDVPQVEETTRRHLEHAEPYSIEYRLRHKNGSYRWVFSRGSAVRDATGKPLRLIGAITDITERKTAELALVQARSHYQNLLRTATDGIHILEPDGRLIEASPSFYRMLGYDPDHPPLLGIEDWDALGTPEELRQRVTGLLKQPGIVQTLHRRRDGGTFPVEINAQGIELNGRPCLYASSRDIGERKRQEILLQARLNLTDLAMRGDMDQLLQSALDTAEDLTGSHTGFFHLVDADQENLTLQNWSTHTLEAMGQAEGKGRHYPISQSGAWADCLREGRPVIHNDPSPPPRTGPLPGHNPLGRQLVVPILRHDRIVALMGVGNKDTDYHENDVRVMQTLADIAMEAVERRQAADALRRSEELYRSLFELESDALLLVDATNHQILDCNESAKILYGYSRAEFLKLKAEEISAEPEATAKTVGGGSYFVPLRWHRKKHGERFAVEISATAIQRTGADIEITAVRDITARHRMEEALRADEQLLREISLLSLDFVYSCVTDEDGNYTLDWHAGAVEKIMGCAAAELMSRRCWGGFVVEEDQPVFQARVTGLKAGESAVCELRLRRDDSSVIWVNSHARCSADPARPGSLHLHGALTDITERKRAEQALKISEEKFVKLFRSTPAMVSVSRLDDGVLLDINDEFQRVMGYDRQTRIGQSTLRLGLWMDDCDRQTIVQTVRQAGQIRDYELKLRTHDGGDRVFRYFGDSIAIDGIPCLLSAFVDVTESKKHENQWHAERNLLHALMDNLPDAIYFKDTESRFTRINLSQARNLGLDRVEDAIGKTDADFISATEARQRLVDEQRLMTTGESIIGAVETWGTGKPPRWLSTTKVPIRDATGKITGMVGVTRDISDYKWAELERQRLDQQLLQAQKMEAIGTLAGGIAHDFNNILAAMSGYSYLLQQDTVGNAVAQDNLAEILKATDRAKELVQQILTFSRHRERKPQIMRLEMVIKEAVKFLRASLPAHIRIQLELSEQAPPVLADPTQIYQVMVNLATNALHAMEHQPGQLTISLDPFTPDKPFREAHPEAQPVAYARITVADTGHGMDAKTLGRIFEPFFTTKPVGKGTGLGLSVVHGIVQSHSGVITVESEIGKGTAFRLHFPAQIPPTAPPANPAAKMPAGSGQKILLVDDEPPLTKTLEQILSRLNYQVVALNNPVQACALVRENPALFDAVLTDLTMPEMNGLELARQIYACRPDLPIILASGFAAEVPLDSLASVGIRKLLEKPIAMGALAEVLHRLLNRPTNSA